MKAKPSITSLLQILDKPALISWANKQGLEGIDIRDARAKALGDGISIHRQIQQFHQHATPLKDEAHQKAFEEFLNGKDVVATEKVVSCEHFQGRYDARVNVGGKHFIYDYKNSKSHRVYFEHRLQLVAYSMCEPCDGLAIVHVPKFNLVEVVIEDRAPYERVLLALVQIYHARIELAE